MCVLDAYLLNQFPWSKDFCWIKVKTGSVIWHAQVYVTKNAWNVGYIWGCQWETSFLSFLMWTVWIYLPFITFNLACQLTHQTPSCSFQHSSFNHCHDWLCHRPLQNCQLPYNFALMLKSLFVADNSNCVRPFRYIPVYNDYASTDLVKIAEIVMALFHIQSRHAYCLHFKGDASLLSTHLCAEDSSSSMDVGRWKRCVKKGDADSVSFRRFWESDVQNMWPSSAPFTA